MIKEYFLPKTLEEAFQLKSSIGDRAKYLAGGTELNLKMFKNDYDVFIDLRMIKMNEIKIERDEVHIGSAVTFQDLIGNESVPDQLKKAANHMECRNIRNMATIGGNIGAGRTVGDLLPSLFILNAYLKVFGKDELISVEDYVTNSMSDLIEKIIIKNSEIEKQTNSLTFRRVSSDLSIIGVAVSYNKIGEIYSDVKLAVGGMGPKVKRFKDIEMKISGNSLNKEFVTALVKESVTPITDIKGTAEFKRYLVSEMICEALGLI